MKIVGIVAEFNPMHNGHKYLIDTAKELTGADIAICVMSGNFTQAGNITLVDKFKRAKTAIENGIDVVIELPTIYATSSAEFFSYSAVKLLNSLGCVDYICFGSETGDTRELVQIAYTLTQNEEEIWRQTTENLKAGISFAKARQEALENILTEDEVNTATSSNNILAIEYIKALIKLKSSIEPIAIKREENVSATQIRELISGGDLTLAKALSLEPLQKGQIVQNTDLMNILTYYLVSSTKNQIQAIKDVTEGLENSIKDNCNIYDYNEYIQEIKSKRYQLSKIKRIVINMILGITKEQNERLQDKAYYAHILAIDTNKKNEILSMLNSTSKIPVITSLNDEILERQTEENKESLLLDIKATNIHSSILKEEQNKDYKNRL